MKNTKRKQGISLIVLVITIIIMIILASSVIITLSNTGIIGKAEKAVEKSDFRVVEQAAQIAWVEAYLNNDIVTDEQYKEYVEKKLKENKINPADYDLTITAKEISVEIKYTGPTLGSLITGPDDYGKTVNYSVTVDGKVYDDWQIYYHTDDYIFLVSSKNMGSKTLETSTTVESLSKTTVKSLPKGKNTLLDLYNIFRVGNNTKYNLTDANINSKAVAQLIADYTDFANTVDYRKYVVGAIGGPTIELLAAAREAKGYTPTLLPLQQGIMFMDNNYGYLINRKKRIAVTNDGLYVPSEYEYWLTSPSAYSASTVMTAGKGEVGFASNQSTIGVRPVVCLKYTTPAKLGTGEYDFELIKYYDLMK